MTQEQLRMQMLAGIITEGQYKEKMEEVDSMGKIKKSYPAPGFDSVPDEEDKKGKTKEKNVTWDTNKVATNVAAAAQDAIDPYKDEFTFKLVPGTATKNSFTIRDGGRKEPEYVGYDVKITDNGKIVVYGVRKGPTILGKVTDSDIQLGNNWYRRIVNTDADKYYLNKRK
jgi:hypothetical protein